MMDLNNKDAEHEEPEINLLTEWLPKISGENRAYIKGASKALFYIQEIQGLPSNSAKPFQKNQN